MLKYIHERLRISPEKPKYLYLGRDEYTAFRQEVSSQLILFKSTGDKSDGIYYGGLEIIPVAKQSHFNLI